MSDFYVILHTDNQLVAKLIPMLFGAEKVIHHSGRIDSKALQTPEELTHVLTLPGDSREALEAIPATLKHFNLTLSRILAVADAAFFAQQTQFGHFLDFWAHFADVFIFTNSAPQASFISTFRKKYKDRPMLIHRLPEDSSKLSEILFPEARRISQYFEPDDADASAIEWGAEDSEDDPDDFDENPKRGKKQNPQKVNQHKKKKTNVNQLDLEAVEPPVGESYFERDAVGGYKIKFQAP